MDKVLELASQNAVVIFSLTSCCMCHSIKSLFCDLGVHIATHELDEVPRGREIEKVLGGLMDQTPPVPAVFIGRKLIGSTKEVMSLHLGGELIPLLKAAGAIWL
ncbi:putative glutaredoxin-C14 [Magnolia sinica]|uniref:putative glutaredoxin-C14 n=1 Tax=Magnolia sinica TaxID=86752 RepID=UPI00265A72B2|nr:putative glutaredoxin-C14 [Magnolia sinica]